MKFNIIAIIVLFCNLHVLCACANSCGSQDFIEVKVKGDKDIIVANLFNDSLKIYGDQVNGQQYGDDDNFETKQVVPNDTIFGIKVYRKEGRVRLSVKYDELKDSVVVIKIYPAVCVDQAGYCPDENPLVIKVKKETADAGDENTSGDDQSKKKENSFNGNPYGLLPLLVAIIISVVVAFFIFIQNRKMRRVFMEISDLRNLIDKREEKNVRVSLPQVEQQKKKETCSMTDDDIKKFVVEQIKSLQKQIDPAISRQTMISSQVECETNHANKQCPAIDTDDVKYHQDGNFFTLEHAENKIFRIYSRTGEYYYTVVDDSDVRKELASMLQAFTDCLSIQTTVNEANRIEPVSDGKLIKENGRFSVDDKNKLVVKYV